MNAADCFAHFESTIPAESCDHDYQHYGGNRYDCLKCGDYMRVAKVLYRGPIETDPETPEPRVA